MNLKVELSSSLENQLHSADLALQQNERERFINTSRRYLNGDLNLVDFVSHIKSIFNNPQTLKEVFGDFVNLINQTSNVATTSENKQCVQKTDMNSKMNDMNNNETVLSSESGKAKEFHQKEYESDESWKEANEELEIEDDDDGLFVPNSKTKRSRKFNATSGPSRKKTKYSETYHDSQKKERQRRPANFWTPEESEKLLEIINKSEYGPKRWKLIAKALNSATGGNKTPSQCSQHYHRVIAPGINKGAWTKEEDEKLIRLYKQYGSCWSLVCRHMNNRTDTQCARRWAKLQRMKNYNKTQDSEEQSDISTSDNIMNDEENSNIKNNRNEISTNEKKETSNSSLQTSTTLHIPLRRMRRISQLKNLSETFEENFEEKEKLYKQRTKKTEQHEQKVTFDKVDENDIVNTLMEIKNNSILLTKNEKTKLEVSKSDKTVFDEHAIFADFVQVALDNKHSFESKETKKNEESQINTKGIGEGQDQIKEASHSNEQKCEVDNNKTEFSKQ